MNKIIGTPTLGKNIQQIRISKGMTQHDVVDKLKLYGRTITVSHYGHIEQNRKNIFAPDLVLLKIIFDVSYDEFFKNLINIEELKSSVTPEQPELP